MSVKRRHYHSPQRARQAEATRQAVLEAAEALFAERGYAAATMQAIASQAGIALPTVYLHFPGKVAIVTALAEEIVSLPELSVELVTRARDARDQIRIGAQVIRRLNERSWLVVEILRTSHGSDPQIAALWADWRKRHDDAIRRGVEAIAAHDGLRPGLEIDTAVDILFVLAGPEVYRGLVHERGWLPDQFETWLFRTACQQLLDSTAEDEQAPRD